VYNHPFPLESATTGSMEYVADGLDLRTMGMTQISPWHENGIDACHGRVDLFSIENVVGQVAAPEISKLFMQVALMPQ
jgi:hypothetical protein